MEKLVYLLWRPTAIEAEPWARDLRGGGAAAVLDAGARGLQVNVDDGEVAAAVVRLSTFDLPIGAVVSVWLDTATGPARAAVESELARRSERLAGYLVTESVRLAPPTVAPGARTAGFANIALLRRPPHLDRAEWLERWQGRHTAVALETQRTLGYVQNVVVRPVTADAPAIDGVVEELFPADALADLHVFFDTGGDQAELGRRLTTMTESVAHFSGEGAPLDVVPSSRYVPASPFAG